jgi:hypothetical protein
LSSSTAAATISKDCTGTDPASASGPSAWSADGFIRDWSREIDRQLNVTELKLLLEGIEPGRRRLRYQCRATPSGEVR